MEQIALIEKSSPDVNEFGMLNWNKMKALASLIQNFKEQQRISYAFQKEAKVLQYLRELKADKDIEGYNNLAKRALSKDNSGDEGKKKRLTMTMAGMGIKKTASETQVFTLLRQHSWSNQRR